MTDQQFSEKAEMLKKIIAQRAVIRNKGISKRGGTPKWIFDLRLVLLNSVGLKLVTELIAEQITKNNPKGSYSLGCLTIAADPLIGTLICRLQDIKKEPVNGFIVRKQKKTYGLEKNLEGNLDPKSKVLLVDDLINSGESIRKTVEVVEQQGGKVKEVYVIVDFTKDHIREYFLRKKIAIHSLFTLQDFNLSMSGFDFRCDSAKGRISNHLWVLRPLNIKNEPYLRSAPCVCRGRVYVGSDSGMFYCVDLISGKKIWEFATPPRPKGILSSPACLDKNVCFGDYNGFLYLLDGQSGKVVWKKKICGSVGSSPTIDEKRKKIFIGIESGTRQAPIGGVACIDGSSGKSLWSFEEKGFAHCTPTFSMRHNLVFIGLNSGKAFALNAASGKRVWTISTVGRDKGEIKHRLVLDPQEERLVFGSYDGNVYCIKVANGFPLWVFKTAGPVKAVPIVDSDVVYFGSTDSFFYSVNLKDGRLRWKTKLEGASIGGAITLKNAVVATDSSGFIYALDRTSGKILNWIETEDSFYASPCLHDKYLILGNRILQCWSVDDII